jgi:hypothetical protein
MSPGEKHVPSILHLSQNSNLFVRAQMFAFSYRFDQGRVKHEGRTINPEIAPTAELLHAQILELHASGKAKAQSKSAAVAVSCWKQSDSETNDLLSLTRAAKILHSPESSQLHRGPSFVHRPMESGLSAAIDVDCTTLMGLDVISKAIY